MINWRLNINYDANAIQKETYGKYSYFLQICSKGCVIFVGIVAVKRKSSQNINNGASFCPKDFSWKKN